MKQSDWSEANSRSACHKISLLSTWNPKESLLRWRKHKDVSYPEPLQTNL